MRIENDQILNSRNACIISITKQGNELAKKIADHVKSREGLLECYTLKKYSSYGFKEISSLKNFFKYAFDNFDTIIAIMATGIVIREIAPFLETKWEDPGIIVLDVNGTNVISLLSGHLGHANENTLKISKAIGSNPVITTASDNLNLKSVDSIAEDLELKLIDFNKAKQITALILQGKTVTIFSDYKLPKSYNSFKIKKLDSLSSNQEIKIIISEYNNLDSSDDLSVQLFPKTIFIGIGTKKNIDGNLVVDKIKKLLKLNNISQYSINALATIEDKQDEKGILFAKKYFDVDIKIINKKKILMIENKFKTSEFVRSVVGVGSVSEACGFLSSNQGENIGTILKEDGVTLSLWRRKMSTS